MVEATENGWWYSSSIPGNQRVVMLFSDTDSKTFRDCNAVAGFLSLLQQTRYISPKLQQQCSGISWTSPVRVFTEPASSSRAHQVQGRRWLAVGDAAMSFDPLSSQGLWVGLQSAEIAANSAAGELENTAINGNIYSNWSEHVYRQDQQEKKNYYAMEARWRSQTFWQRRCS